MAYLPTKHLCIVLLAVLVVTNVVVHGADRCETPKTQLETCYMVDYPVYLHTEEADLAAADENARWKYEMFTEEHVNDDFLETEECANSIRAFKCAMTMKRCEVRDGKTVSLFPCKETCNSFYDTCYPPEWAKAYKEKTCSHLETSDCTAVAIPPTPPPAFNGDKKVDGMGLEGVIFKTEFELAILGNMEFGIKNLTINSVDAVLDWVGEGDRMNLAMKDAKISAEVMYWFKQFRFPWLKSKGSINTGVNGASADLVANFEYDTQEMRWVVSREMGVGSRFESKFVPVKTGLQWLKAFFLNRFEAKILELLKVPVEKAIGMFVEKILPNDFGVFFAQGRNSDLSISSNVHFQRNPESGKLEPSRLVKKLTAL